MKVTQVLYAGKGGHGSVAHSLIKADKSTDFEYQLIYFGVEKLDTDYLNFCNQNAKEFATIQKKQGEHFQSWRKYLKVLKKQQADLILLHSMTLIVPTIWYCLFHRAKLVSVEHQSNQFKRKSEWLWSFLALIFANKVVYLTPTYLEEIRQKMAWMMRKSKIYIIPNGIDVNYFVPVEKGRSETIKIGMASRINSLRDHETLITAFEMLKTNNVESELHLAGDGEGMNILTKRAEKSPFRSSIFLHGNLNEANLLIFLQSLDIYVHSTFAETMSTSILQAMSVGLPVIVSQIPGTITLFEEDKEGFFFESKNACELASKMEMLISDLDLTDRIKIAARKKVIAEYDSQIMISRYKKLIFK